MATVQSAERLVTRFNEGTTLYNPSGLVAAVVDIDDGSGEYCIEVREPDSEDLIETFSDLSEFTEWILDSESGYVD